MLMMLPLPCPCHRAHLVLHAQDHAEHVGVEGRGIAFGGLVGDRANLALGAGIVHCDIETPKALDRLVDESADVILVAHVGLDEFGLGAERAQLVDERLADIVRRPATTTFAPFLAKAIAAARPMPVSAPVIKTTELLLIFCSSRFVRPLPAEHG